MRLASVRDAMVVDVEPRIGRIGAPQFVNALPGGVPRALIRDRRLCPIRLTFEHAPDWKLGSCERFKVCIQQPCVPGTIHSDRWARCRDGTNQAPRIGRSEAVLAVSDLGSRFRFIEHHPTWILLSGFAVIPIVEHDVWLDQQSLYVRGNARIRDAGQLVLDQYLQVFGSDWHVRSRGQGKDCCGVPLEIMVVALPLGTALSAKL
jgi:hypothetical protein